MIEPIEKDWVLCSHVSCSTALVGDDIESLDDDKRLCSAHRAVADEYEKKDRIYCHFSGCRQVIMRTKWDPSFEDVVLCSRHKGAGK